MRTSEKKSSKNYEWFKFLANNRKLSKKHLFNLSKQFDKYGNITEISPITVNNHGFIIDGQHRFMICKQLGLDVFYNEVEVDKEITPAINSNQKPWTALDYISFFAAYKPEYEILNRFIGKNEINFPVASAALFPGKSRSNIYDSLRTGQLEVSEVLDEAQKRIDIIHEITELMNGPLTERYVYAILRCLYMEHFDINRFIDKLKSVTSSSHNIANPRSSNIADVMRNIETIYNFKAREGSTVLLFR